MLKTNCREQIIHKLPLLTKTERKIAEYVLNNYELILRYSVAELAHETGVSDATVVRFCRSVGYLGYQDFKIHLAGDLIPQEQQLNPTITRDDDTQTICRKTFTAEINVLQATLINLDFAVIEKIAEKISRAGQLIILGTGGSQVVAMDAQHKFLKVGIRCFVYEDIDLQLMSSCLVGEGDVVICISFSGGNRNVINCLKYAKDAGAYTVGILSQIKSPIVRQKLLDAVVYSAFDETIFQSESVSTRIAQLAILDSIVSKVAFMEYDRSLDAIQKTRRATSENKV